MSMNDLVTLFTSIAFPSAVTAFLLYNQSNSEKYHREQIEDLRKTVERNSDVIEKLVDRLNK